MDPADKWKIDRRVPVAVILAFILQIAGALIWATELDARVSHMERESGTFTGVTEKFVRMEERMENMRQDLGIIRRQLDRMTERLIRK